MSIFKRYCNQLIDWAEVSTKRELIVYPFADINVLFCPVLHLPFLDHNNHNYSGKKTILTLIQSKTAQFNPYPICHTMGTVVQASSRNVINYCSRQHKRTEAWQAKESRG